MRIHGTEYLARNDQQVVFNGFSHKFRASAPRSLQKQIEGSFATLDLKVILKLRYDQVSLASVVLKVF